MSKFRNSLTKEQAVEFFDSETWKEMTDYGIVSLQLYETFLAVPFGEFHRATEAVLGRPVWSHEFAFPENLQDEFEGKRPAPTFEDVLALIPEEKRIILAVSND